MKTLRFFVVALAVMALPFLSRAQSMYMAKQYYDQGQYLEAAKQLRPLADGGNAEAQVMAAQLFFEGKGVARNEAQGIKYATLAADKGNEEAIELLANHFWSTNPKKSFEILTHYTNRHPYLKQKKVGIMLAECYFRPHGTEQDEALGWELAESNENWEDYLKSDKVAALYYDYKMRRAGRNSLEDYADFMFLQHQTKEFYTICEYIKRLHPDIINYYTMRANQGNNFAQAMIANNFFEQGNLPEARRWLNLSLVAGSAYAKSLERKITFNPVIYSNITGKWAYEDYNLKLYILKIEHQYDRTIFHFDFKAVHAGAKVTFPKGCYFLCNGRKYMMISPETVIGNKRTSSKGNDTYFKLQFQAIPTNWSELSLGYNGQTYYSNIRHTDSY